MQENYGSQSLQQTTLAIIILTTHCTIIASLSSFAGLISKLTNQVNEGNRAACKKCGYGKVFKFK